MDSRSENDPYRNVDYDKPTALAAFAADSLADRPIPPREWHVEELIPAKTVTLLNGDGGTGKSLLALQLAVATIQEKGEGYWAGRAVRPGKVVYFSAEDDVDELHRRLADIAASCDLGMADLAGLTIAPMAGKDAILAAPQGKSNILKPTQVFVGLHQLLRTVRPDLYIIDTLADAYGGEENQRAQARQFIGMLRGLCISYDTTGLVLAHPSLSGMASGSGSSGSTAWNNSVRSRLYFERAKDGDGKESDPDVRILRTVKANYGPIGQEIRFRWEAGVFKPATGGGMAGAATESKAERVFLDLLRIRKDEGRHVSPHENAPTYAPAAFSRDPRNEGVNKRGLEAAMNRLFASGKIKAVQSEGPPSKRKTVIAATEGR
ncbi:AAA family ATPase [Mesorhizobium sp. M2D.F.Ca.ET.225.01.1.1]|uniref:AAA family ATPase n=1 Tax=unclassified Mesorhizobium TaxID=325217 RepID=UPI000FD1E5E1|nr:MULTISPECIES: AAA family ATPase [unclassified Mesorhizobium]TGP55768.1 AAA family ATPase [Mesorhizobium sp. M2D.F.Ca.ET.226.01.1.1]TGP68226.1 AAA family ATPase [Mesorhizobium sp. M2D.F.Ca.ET.225.01.1.1]